MSWFKSVLRRYEFKAPSEVSWPTLVVDTRSMALQALEEDALLRRKVIDGTHETFSVWRECYIEVPLSVMRDLLESLDRR